MIKKIGIDVGSCFIRTVIPGEPSSITEEPAVTAITENGKIVACGTEAIRFDAGAPGTVFLSKLIPDSGELSDAGQAVAIFSYILKKNRMKGADVYLSLSGRCGDEAERLFVDAAQRAGARDVFVVNSLYAAARGCSLKGSGDSLIIDIGYETASMAAYSRGKEAAVSHSEFAGAAFDRAIISYVMKKYHMSLTHEEADRIKKEIGTMVPSEKKQTDIRVMRHAVGLPKVLTVTEEEISSAMEPVFDKLTDEIIALVRTLPSEPDKLILTGGGARLRALAPALAPIVCIPVEISPDPELAVIRGLSAIIERE